MSAEPSLQNSFRHAIASDASEFDVALLVAQVVDDALDIVRVRESLDAYLADTAYQQISDPEQLLAWFREQGFGQNLPNQAKLQFSNIQWVMANRQGLPITLAVLLVEVARGCGLTCQGINFPGHFIVDISGVLVDPVTMLVVAPEHLSAGKLDAVSLQRMMQPASAQMLGLRMLNNIKAFHLHHRDLGSALDIIDYQLALSEADVDLAASLHFERGEIWQQLGAYSVAKKAFEACVDLVPNSELGQKAQARVVHLADRAEVLH